MKQKRLPKSEWDKVAEWWDSEVGDTGAWHQVNSIDPEIFKLIGAVKKKKVLEIGCGNGYLARKLAKKGAYVTAIDLSKKLLGIAIDKERENPLGIKYLLRDASNLYGTKSLDFDLVVCDMAIMDIRDAKRMIKEIARALKNKGKFIFSLTHPVFVERDWVALGRGGKKEFAKAVNDYLTPITKKHSLWASGVTASHYNRPISVYIGYLKNSGFLVEDLSELPSKKKVKKATKEEGNVSLRMTRYTTDKDRKLKEKIKKEIPEFLIISAVKILPVPKRSKD